MSTALAVAPAEKIPGRSIPHTEQRRDIEGLRAVAVSAVIAAHLIGAPVGGFIGVDIFFVISGFLITGLLIREYERTGGISFREFYARRVRRILPAALLTLAVTCLAARLLFFDSRARETYVDAFWAALSLENWHLARIGTDYFQSTRPPSAIQQYWSLSVEEQFYLVWPLLIVSVGWVAKRWRPQAVRGVLVAVLAMVTISSFGWAMYQSGADTTVAYFSTFTRGWELGIGGLTALAVGLLRRQPLWLARILMWGGLVAVGFAVVATEANASFPAPGALPGVLGTVAIIAGGSAAVPPASPLLTNPLSRFVGRISYSLYLWHWPVIIITATLLPKGSWQEITVALGVTLALSVISFYAVEQPIRQTTWFSRKVSERPRRGLPLVVKHGYTALVSGLAVVVVVAAAWPQPTVTGAAVKPRPPSSPTNEPVPTGPVSPIEGWQKKVEAAVSASTWPDLKPSLDQLTESRAAEWNACGNVGPDNLDQCRFGPRSVTRAKTIMILGDSVGISWIPTLRAAVEAKGWQVQGLTFGECPAARIDAISKSGEKEFTARCSAHQEFALRHAASARPAVVILASTESTLTRIVGATTETEAAAAWEKAETAAVRQVTAPGTQVVILSSPPARKDLPSCATRVNSPVDCLTDVTNTWKIMSTTEARAAKATKANYLNTKEWTCTPDDYCPSFIDTTPIMADGVHLTNSMALSLGPLLANALKVG